MINPKRLFDYATLHLINYFPAKTVAKIETVYPGLCIRTGEFSRMPVAIFLEEQRQSLYDQLSEDLRSNYRMLRDALKNPQKKPEMWDDLMSQYTDEDFKVNVVSIYLGGLPVGTEPKTSEEKFSFRLNVCLQPLLRYVLVKNYLLHGTNQYIKPRLAQLALERRKTNFKDEKNWLDLMVHPSNSVQRELLNLVLRLREYCDHAVAHYTDVAFEIPLELAEKLPKPE